jgi:hypothetical protein
MSQINSAVGILGAVTQILTQASGETQGAGEAKASSPMHGADKSSFGEGDSAKSQSAQSADAKGPLGDIMKMLEEFFKSLMKMLGMDKKEEAGDKKPSGAEAGKDKAAGAEGKKGGGVMGAITDFLKAVVSLLGGGGSDSGSVGGVGK